MALSREQNEAWRSLVMLTHVLDDALDRQSQRDGGLPHAYYKVLVFLYESRDRRLSMSELAATQRYSISRVTHAVDAMERSGWLRRERSETDRRVQLVVLTDDGIALVRKVSAAQVRDIRETVFSTLTDTQVAQLAQLASAITSSLDSANAI
jgi:DNA-binding MarR family transcriptional regulator